jgi:uncharacterized OsmC-like protein
MDLTKAQADVVLDGGDLDCGSGLVLLIREHMQQVPDGGLLEMRSREPTVGLDLPPWCRVVGHEFLGAVPGAGDTRYFVRKKESQAELEALAEDKRKARNYEWRLRIRASDHLTSTVYCRNFSFKVGQPASFEERDSHPSAVELMLGSLGGALATAYATDCGRAGLDAEDIEVTVRGTLHNVLAHLGIEEGDPSLASVTVKCFVSSMDEEARLRAVWQQTVARSPIAATLAKAVELETKLMVV